MPSQKAYKAHSRKGFTLAEIAVSMLILLVFISAAMPMITKMMISTGIDSDAAKCIETANGNPSDPSCTQATQKCLYNKGNACGSFESYSSHSNATYANAALSMLEEACDGGGEKACKVLISRCIMNSANCDVADGKTYDIHKYLAMAATSSDAGKISMFKLLKGPFDLGLSNIFDQVLTDCLADAGSIACKFFTNEVHNYNPQDETDFTPSTADKILFSGGQAVLNETEGTSGGGETIKGAAFYNVGAVWLYYMLVKKVDANYVYTVCEAYNSLMILNKSTGAVASSYGTSVRMRSVIDGNYMYGFLYDDDPDQPVKISKIDLANPTASFPKYSWSFNSSQAIIDSDPNYKPYQPAFDDTNAYYVSHYIKNGQSHRSLGVYAVNKTDIGVMSWAKGLEQTAYPTKDFGRSQDVAALNGKVYVALRMLSVQNWTEGAVGFIVLNATNGNVESFKFIGPQSPVSVNSYFATSGAIRAFDNYLYAGAATSPENRAVMATVLKIDPTDYSTEWSTRFGRDVAQSGIPEQAWPQVRVSDIHKSGNYIYISGYENTLGHIHNYIAKINDTTGELLWKRRIGNSTSSTGDLNMFKNSIYAYSLSGNLYFTLTGDAIDQGVFFILNQEQVDNMTDWDYVEYNNLYLDNTITPVAYTTVNLNAPTYGFARGAVENDALTAQTLPTVGYDLSSTTLDIGINSELLPGGTGHYLTTTDTNNVTGITNKIIKFAVTKSEPSAETRIRWVVSFDGRTTWKYKDGANWTVFNGSNLATATMADWTDTANTTDEIVAALSNLNMTSLGTSLDYAVWMINEGTGDPPSVDKVDIYYK